MMKPHLALLMLALLMTTGCTQGTFGRSDTEPRIPDVYVGRKGITMDFVDGMPPYRVWDSSGMHIALDLRNEGTHDVVDGRIMIGGYDQELVAGLMPLTGGFDFAIPGKSQFNPKGEMAILEFEADTIDIPMGSQFLNLPVQAVACYTYRTMVGVPVCIDVSGTGAVKDRGECYVNDWASSRGQGAPVAVTRVIQDPFPVDETANTITMQYTIHVQNLGGGKVIGRSAYDDPCTENTEVMIESMDWVEYIIGVEGEIITSQCEPVYGGAHMIKLYDDKNFIICTATFDRASGTHGTLLNVALDYGYYDSVTTTVEAVRMG